MFFELTVNSLNQEAGHQEVICGAIYLSFNHMPSMDERVTRVHGETDMRKGGGCKYRKCHREPPL